VIIERLACSFESFVVMPWGPMSIPDYQSLMLPVLAASSKGEVRIGSVVDEIAAQLELSLEESK
jgi:hypothetical protein